MYKLRPHHLLCIQGFHGEGYDSEFVKNMQKVINNINKQVIIQITKDCDIICNKCPNKLNHNVCKYPKVKKMDQEVLRILKLELNKTYLYIDLLKKIKETFKSQQKLYKICNTCEWNKTCYFYMSIKT